MTVGEDEIHGRISMLFVSFRIRLQIFESMYCRYIQITLSAVIYSCIDKQM